MNLSIIISLLSEITCRAADDFNGQSLLLDIEALDVAKLVIEIEKRFAVIIFDEIVHTFITLEDVAAHVDMLTGK